MSSGALVDDGAPTPRDKWVPVGSEQFSTMAEGKDNLKMMESGKREVGQAGKVAYKGQPKCAWRRRQTKDG